MKYFLSLVFLFILKTSLAQEQNMAWDTLHFNGNYLVKCACIKQKKAVVDLRSKSDTGKIDRFVFDYSPNKKSIKIEKGDTIPFTYSEPFLKNINYHYANSYLVFNEDGIGLVVYRLEYVEGSLTRHSRLFISEEPLLKDYFISDKCSRKTLTKPDFIYRLGNWFRRTF